VRNYTLKGKRELIRKTTGLEQGVLLDIGAGTGAFTNTMQQAGWNVTGLEPDRIARENALTNYNLNLAELGELDNLVGETFDAITMWHVLEHVHDLHGYFEKFFEILKPGGRLIVAVPNYTSYDATVYKDHWAAYDVPRHLYHFSPKSMQVLLEKEGFMLETIKPMWFDSFYVSMLSEKYKHGKNNLLSAVWKGLVSNIKAMSDTTKCSSVIYIIRKK
jgi:SAM-dependent methyltransferase